MMSKSNKNIDTVEKPPLLAHILGWSTNPRTVNNPKALRKAVAGKNILITGASYGLGEATAHQLAATGATVFIVARTKEKLDEVAEAIKAKGGKVYAYAADLTDMAQIEVLVEQILQKHQHVDIFVNNAGKSIRRSVNLSFDRFKDYERTNAINYLGPVRLTLALLPSMKARGQGQIINVSTIGVRIPPGPRWAAYQASKGAYDVWLRSVGMEMESFGIKTSTIYMALIYTRMSAPTPIYRILPGLMPEQAAHLIERAIIEQPLEINPPWLRAGELASTFLRSTTRKIMMQMYNFSDDSKSAKGEKS